MAVKKSVKRVRPARKAAKPVKARKARKAPAMRPRKVMIPPPEWAEQIAPRVLALKDYLGLVAPGEHATEIERNWHRFASECLREIESAINEADPLILRNAAGLPCYGAWPRVPPLANIGL